MPITSELVFANPKTYLEVFNVLKKEIFLIESELHEFKERIMNTLPVSVLGLCCLCKLPNKKLITHHITYFPELTILICGSCHKTIHSDNKLYSILRPPHEDVSKFYKFEVKLNDQ